MSEEGLVTTVAVDTPALEVSPSVLEKLEPLEFNAIRDAQEHEKKYPEPDEDADGTDPQRAKRGTSNKLQKRFDKLTRRAREAESRAQAAERRAAEVEAKIAGNGAAQPDLSETIRRQDEIIRTQHELLQPNEESRRIEEEKLQSLRAKTQAEIAAMPDAKAIKDGLERGEQGMNPRVSRAITLAIAEEENAVEIVAFLGRHPEEIAAMQALSPLAVAARIGKISNKLEANATASREKPRPPAPISTVGGSSARSGIPLDELSPSEYIRVMNKKERERRRL